MPDDTTTTTSTTPAPCAPFCPVPGWRQTPVLTPGTLETPDCGPPGTTTSTTPPPCIGVCNWTYVASSFVWVLLSSTCPTGCHCFGPTFCPASDVTYQGACGFTACDVPPVNCISSGGTTTTQSPECQAAGLLCPGVCSWICEEQFGAWDWYRGSTVINPDECLCACASEPDECINCFGPNTNCPPCATTHTPCIGGGGACQGACSWVWQFDPTVQRFNWVQTHAGCGGPGGTSVWCLVDGLFTESNLCNCNPPLPIDIDACYTGPPITATAACYCQGPGCSACQSTTTCSPNSGTCGCTGQCFWAANGSTWSLISGCIGCSCVFPAFPPAASNQITTTDCQEVFTTITPPTTTTTQAPCTGGCGFFCNACTGIWVQTGTPTCSSGCACSYPTIPCVPHATGGTLFTTTACYLASISTTTPTPSNTTNSVCLTSTTTITPPTTTTTTTTPAPWCCCVNDFERFCTQVAPGYADCLAWCDTSIATYATQADCLAGCVTPTTTTTTAGPCAGQPCYYNCSGNISGGGSLAWVAVQPCPITCTSCADRLLSDLTGPCTSLGQVIAGVCGTLSTTTTPAPCSRKGFPCQVSCTGSVWVLTSGSCAECLFCGSNQIGSACTGAAVPATCN